MENGDKTIRPEDVVAKLKDDGDFDRLRLKIIQKLKDDEELRNSIATVVKQSSVLSRAGAENMKPRQLSDAIREDVGDKLMTQLSDGVTKIIRDEGGMRKEIKETIQRVYNRMLNPDYIEEGEGVGEGSPSQSVLPSQNETVISFITDSVNRVDEKMKDIDVVSEPPGYSLCTNNVEPPKEGTRTMLPQGMVQEDLKNGKHNDSRDVTNHNGQAVPLVSQGSQATPLGDCSDEDPDLPPGFG